MTHSAWAWTKVVAVAVMLPAAVDSLDMAVRSELLAHRDSRLQPVMRAATNLGRRDVLFGLLLGIAVLDPLEGPATARLAVTALVGTNLVVEGFKRAIDRPRPHGVHERSNASFPSGHAASAFGLAVVFARGWKRQAIWFWLLATLVAFSRMFLDRHYLSDVVVAIVIGIACANVLARWQLASTWGIARLSLPNSKHQDSS